MDDDEEAGASAAASLACAAPARAVWSPALAQAIVARTAAGESLRGLCRDPAMPAFRTVSQWLQRRPQFRAAMEAARVAAGGPFRGRRTTYCEATAEAIWGRLAAGEPLVSICADPAMPCWSTVHRWLGEQPEFAAAVGQARAWIAERTAQEALELCRGVTPQTANAAKVQLAHLRWHAAKLGPKRYGSHRAQDPAPTGPAQPKTVIHTYIKKYVMATPEEYARGECGRWSEEPAEHLDSMVSVSDPSPMAGARLPPPAQVREPLSCQGPNPTYLPNGGAVEAEVEEPGREPGEGEW